MSIPHISSGACLSTTLILSIFATFPTFQNRTGAAEAAITLIDQVCGGTDTNDTTSSTGSAPNGAFRSNLRRLLDSLSASSSNSTPGGYYRNSAAGSGSPDAVYGASLCRGDVPAAVCQQCVAEAAAFLPGRCARDRSAIIWYDECWLKYSDDRSLFFRMEHKPGKVKQYGNGNASDPAPFVRRLEELAKGLAARVAAERGPPEKFAVREASLTTSLQKLYMLAQCMPYLTEADCRRCFWKGYEMIRGNNVTPPIGARALMPSCWVRYEVYPFYNAAAEATPPPLGFASTPRQKKMPKTTVSIVVAGAACLVLVFIYLCLKGRVACKKEESVNGEIIGRSNIATAESLRLDFTTIEAATRNFSNENKIGEGGFGTVYKGTLPNGQEVAVKRLSRSSMQGAEEFKNEVALVAKLQHRNLARLLGFCLEGEEKILVYEFVPNKSLDYFLFDPNKRGQLDWLMRCKIIGGIARGILYLHEDSRLRIIHRDLKTSNILLDVDMSPKISDFGLARMFGVDQTTGKTCRVVGTYGYMSPEYAMHGHFSIKSDVFSYGVLVLEVISGKKNRTFYETDGIQDLLSHAWTLWKDGTPLELMDPTLSDSYSENEVIRCIHIGLLCVQEDEAIRPTMATVVLLLSSYSVPMHVPQHPAFFVHGATESDIPMRDMAFDHTSEDAMPWSINGVSITQTLPR